MVFTRTRLLTGLVTFSMAAAVLGSPARAMGNTARGNAAATLNPITGNIITPENAQSELVADAVMAIVRPVQKTEESVSGQGEGSDRESELRPDESPEQKSEERPEQKPEQSPQQGMEASPEAGKSFTDGSMEGKNEPAGHDGTVTDGGAEGSMPEQDIFRESGVGPAGDAEPAPEEPAASDRASEDPGTSYRAPEGRDGSGGDGGPDRGHEGGRGPM